jgi:hypothetical protein
MGGPLSCSGLPSGAQNVTGTQTGGFVDLTANVPGGFQLIIGGGVNANGNDLVIGGLCGGVIQHGDFMITLNRP